MECVHFCPMLNRIRTGVHVVSAYSNCLKKRKSTTLKRFVPRSTGRPYAVCRVQIACCLLQT